MAGKVKDRISDVRNWVDGFCYGIHKPPACVFSVCFRAVI